VCSSDLEEETQPYLKGAACITETDASNIHSNDDNTRWNTKSMV
jgi:hypothetical protein